MERSEAKGILIMKKAEKAAIVFFFLSPHLGSKGDEGPTQYDPIECKAAKTARKRQKHAPDAKREKKQKSRMKK